MSDIDPANLPIDASNDQLQVLQTCVLLDWPPSGMSGVSDDDYSGGEALDFEWDDESDVGDVYGESISFEYEIPGGEIGFALREGKHNNPPDMRLRLGPDDLVSLTINDSDSVEWYDASGWANEFLDSFESGPVEIEAVNGDSSSEEFFIDCVAVFDQRFHPDPLEWDNTLHEPGGYLPEPWLYPQENLNALLETDVFGEDFNIAETSIEVSVNDTDGLALIEASNDGGETYPLSAQQATSLDGSFADIGSYGTLARSRLGFTARTDLSAQSASPRYGYEGQVVSSFSHEITTDDLPVINDRRFNGSWLEILQDLHERAGMWFVLDHETGKQAMSFEPGDDHADLQGTADWVVRDSGVEHGYSNRDYANQVTVFGSFDDTEDEFLEVTVTADSEIERLQDLGYSEGEATIPKVAGTESDIDSTQDLRSVAISELQAAVGADRPTGRIPIVPKRIQVGLAYDVSDWLPEADGPVAVDRVEFTDGQRPTGTLDIKPDLDISTIVRRVSSDVRRTQRAIRR